MTEHSFTIFADYFQFYIQDEQANGVGDAPWTDGALATRLALEKSAFVVSTARNMDVPVTVSIDGGPPDLELSLWDHVVEFSIDVPSGRLVIAGCTDYFPDAERITLEAGCYEARLLFGNLDRLSEDGLDGDDHYRVEMWKGQAKPLKLLKMFRA